VDINIDSKLKHNNIKINKPNSSMFVNDYFIEEKSEKTSTQNKSLRE
jgi:hypothetical protein